MCFRISHFSYTVITWQLVFLSPCSADVLLTWDILMLTYKSFIYGKTKATWFKCVYLQLEWVSLLAQMIKNLTAIWETQDSISGLRRSSTEGNGYPLQYSCLENSMDRGAWWHSEWGRNETIITQNFGIMHLKVLLGILSQVQYRNHEVSA